MVLLDTSEHWFWVHEIYYHDETVCMVTLCKVAEATSQQSAPPEKKEKKGKKKVNTGAMHCEGLYCRLVDKPSMWEFLDLSGIQATKVQKVHLTHETKLCTFS